MNGDCDCVLQGLAVSTEDHGLMHKDVANAQESTPHITSVRHEEEKEVIGTRSEKDRAAEGPLCMRSDQKAHCTADGVSRHTSMPASAMELVCGAIKHCTIHCNNTYKGFSYVKSQASFVFLFLKV